MACVVGSRGARDDRPLRAHRARATADGAAIAFCRASSGVEGPDSSATPGRAVARLPPITTQQVYHFGPVDAKTCYASRRLRTCPMVGLALATASLAGV